MRFYQVPQGSTRYHQVPQWSTEIDRSSIGFNEVVQGFKRHHEIFQGITRFCRSRWFLQVLDHTFSTTFHKVLQEFCGVLRCATWFTKGSEKVLECFVQSFKEFTWRCKVSKKQPTMFLDVQEGCTVLADVVMLPREHQNAPLVPWAPQSLPKYEIALHNSEGFSKGLKYASTVHKIPENVLKVSRIFKGSSLKNKSVLEDLRKKLWNVPTVLQYYLRFHALLARF